jgi:GNAT superfamily N-acetyltransferase
MIRSATKADTPQLLEMGRQFYATTHYRHFAPYSPESVEHVIDLMLDGVFLVAEEDGKLVGMVGLVVFPHLFNRDHLVANEVVWWVDPDYRGKRIAVDLMAAIEPACKEKGVSAIQMVALANSPPAAAAIYERMGYTHSESSYLKRI